MEALRIASFQDVAALLSLVLTAAGIAFVVIQLRQIKASIVVASHASIYERAAEFRAHLIRHPELRKYFFDKAAVPEKFPDLPRLTSIAEVYLNYLEHIFVIYDGLGRENREALDRFLCFAMSSSPLVRSLITGSDTPVSERFRRHALGLCDRLD